MQKLSRRRIKSLTPIARLYGWDKETLLQVYENMAKSGHTAKSFDNYVRYYAFQLHLVRLYMELKELSYEEVVGKNLSATEILKHLVRHDGKYTNHLVYYNKNF